LQIPANIEAKPNALFLSIATLAFFHAAQQRRAKTGIWSFGMVGI